ncbi:hypothetical protein SY27_04040 [Flavobacterium sp. 316]|uniref:grasp-with-spasm system ATP-grasp peptide maturase n=1 Tax=Flavobacterium sp. 316 TaxID=1603293 RepID=UPI0005DADC4B|nr:grasp-with-spasm system ATP-grasp peptide maturase [Flavobacterium sp. 316]KIX21862.1 hypothetical protein SY27_04040 [Flavobacterium sp. 316]
MILILSNRFDTSTTIVTEWLDLERIDWIRINEEDPLNIHFLGSDIKFELINNKSFFLSEIKSYWYRRGLFNLANFKLSSIKQFNSFQQFETKKIIEFIMYKLDCLNKINSFNNSDVNKLIISDKARKVGLITPIDYLISLKDSFKNLESYNNSLITKSVSGDCMQDFQNFTIYNYTKKITLKDVSSDLFFPSLVQNYIEKKYEIRSFFLNNEFYSMAILSQNSKQTEIDFRDYNKEKPNRTIPFKLPNYIENKIKQLMDELSLNSGSIDMIVTPQNDFVFLEVNPIGQFGMTSYPCNYNIEKLIAKTLKYD